MPTWMRPFALLVLFAQLLLVRAEELQVVSVVDGGLYNRKAADPCKDTKANE